jgi:branched-subunit amino acid ABC-type transport system permease component
MPLEAATLKSDLASIAANPPATVPECAQAWADAVGAYASGVAPPSTTVEAAKGALAGALATAFGSPAAAPGMDAAITAFAVTVAGGMLPLYTGVPPSGPVGFAAQFAGPMPETHADAGEQVGGLIHDWMTTGSATLVAPPNTPVPKWT